MTTLSGSWSDSAGNTGTFIFTPGAGTGGDRRPVPSGGLAPASVTIVQMAPNSVGTDQVLDGSLRADDFADHPRAEYSGGQQTVVLSTTTILEIRSVTMSLPAPGFVIVNASGYFYLTSAGLDSVTCSITTGTAIEGGYAIRADDHGTSDGQPFIPFGATRGFFPGAGTFTVRFVCRRNSGTVWVENTNLTALYVAR
jgi:hypothetical protein